MQNEEVGQNADHIDRLELAGDTDRQAFIAELVEHVEASDICVHHGCGPRQSRRTRHDCGPPGAAECTIHLPARSGRGGGPSLGPSAPRAGRAGGDRKYSPWTREETVPAVASVLDQVVEAFENSVPQPVPPPELPTLPWPWSSGARGGGGAARARRWLEP